MREKVQEVEEKIFFDLKIIIDNLSKINSIKELIDSHELVSDLADHVAFLKILEKNKENLQNANQNLSSQDAEEQTNRQVLEEEANAEEPLEEEVIFTTVINEIEEFPAEDDAISLEPLEAMNLQTEDSFESEDSFSEEPEQDLEVKSSYQDRVAEKERELQELEERRRKIIDFTKEDSANKKIENPLAEAKNPQKIERKFKLANIKGLKVVQDLFDGDPLEQAHQTETETVRDSLQKNNMPTDYMEAAPRKPDFKIDLNDKVAFTKLLFGGDDVELKETIEKMNSFENLEDAKRYLSDLYYKKNWKTVDEYAQRLWDLVENKFQ